MTQPIPFTEWQGQTRYRCPFCAWDNAHEVNVAEHIKWRHKGETIAAPEPVKPSRRRAVIEEPTPGTEPLGFAELETGE